MRNRRAFEAIVRDALDRLPTEFRHALENVIVSVEEEPSEADLRDLDIEEDEELFGIYHGVPLTERSVEDAGLPDRVVIFKGPLQRSFDDADELEEEIRRTVVHELGHHMGLSDDEMPY